MTARVLLDAGDTVWVEDPGCPRARGTFTAASARTVPVPVNAEGLDEVGRASTSAPSARWSFRRCAGLYGRSLGLDRGLYGTLRARRPLADQLILTDFIEEGYFERHIRLVRTSALGPLVYDGVHLL